MLTLISGLPGSGKTTLARSGKFGTPYAADDLFYQAGKYKFEPARLSFAHVTCFENAMRDVEAGHDVCVHNTFTQNWEISPYVMLANLYGVGHRIIRLLCSPEHAIANNVHNVPDSQVRAMFRRMEKPLKFWNYEEREVSW